MKRADVVVVGLGPIGLECVRALSGRQTVRVVGAADPLHAGKDLGELAGLGASGVSIAATAATAYEASGGNVALLCTTSRIATLAPQVEEAVGAGYAVVSTCEELSFPWRTAPAWADKMDAMARDRNVAVLGTGVNPGFVMDRLPLTLAAVCIRVDRVSVERVVDAAKRRGPLRAKVGAGLSPSEFQRGVAEGRLGHVGIGESVSLLAHGLGWELQRIEESIEPVVATASNPRAGIEPGRVAGVHQIATGIVGGAPLVRLELEMSVAAPDPHDRVVIEGDPPIDARIAGGTHGDRATVGAVLSAIAAAVDGPPGLRTVAGLAAAGPPL